MMPVSLKVGKIYIPGVTKAQFAQHDISFDTSASLAPFDSSG